MSSIFKLQWFIKAVEDGKVRSMEPKVCTIKGSGNIKPAKISHFHILVIGSIINNLLNAFWVEGLFGTVKGQEWLLGYLHIIMSVLNMKWTVGMSYRPRHTCAIVTYNE